MVQYFSLDLVSMSTILNYQIDYWNVIVSTPVRLQLLFCLFPSLF